MGVLLCIMLLCSSPQVIQNTIYDTTKQQIETVGTLVCDLFGTTSIVLHDWLLIGHAMSSLHYLGILGPD